MLNPNGFGGALILLATKWALAAPRGGQVAARPKCCFTTIIRKSICVRIAVHHEARRAPKSQEIWRCPQHRVTNPKRLRQRRSGSCERVLLSVLLPFVVGLVEALSNGVPLQPPQLPTDFSGSSRATGGGGIL
ncbi:hypothetical protein TraAM80_10392 [Trypanosoma rangeli]|uniref:Secreted protein n=1 Tax=Trypanosoma rangeli TaxID=5698 RepID=A0A422MPJ3_TRYRA|nr:uncharacterized protein TraAM80_10392 [Trypanosoma rangeli]RNE95122.1 hypothetical protein TraAM80_10392 [Trypanosoma rangeli]|eukprot:RNE95122.1 hypothetical protein TraAM80_10392 [Trypanosoma rangeli]